MQSLSERERRAAASARVPEAVLQTPHDRTKALLVVNRRASRADGGLERALAALRDAGFALDLREPEEPGEIAGLIRAHGPGAACVIVAGGDGTLHHAAPALCEVGVPLGILPLGTANDLARTLGLPLDPEKAARVIAGGRSRWIDLGRLGERLFFNVASFGITGEVTRRLDEDHKRRWGVLSYPIRALAALRSSRSFGVTIEIDGHAERHRALQVAVANGRSYGGGMTIDADAEIDDGTLTVCVIEAQSLWRLVALLPLLRSGRAYRSRSVVTRCGRQVRARTSRPLEVSADGEIVTRTPVELRIEPRALRVLVAEEDPT